MRRLLYCWCARAWILVSLLALLASLAGAQTLQLRPVNPEFHAYQTRALATPSGERGGLVPSPMDWSYTRGMRISRGQRAPFPARYDLREQGKVTPVRNQAVGGPCWAFAAFGSLESCLLPGELRDYSENHMAKRHGFDPTFTQGGNAAIATAYLTRWSGPVHESDDPFNTGAVTLDAPARKHMQQVFTLPLRASATDNDNVKDMLVTYGALFASMKWSETHYRASTKGFYNPTASGEGHGITIVGWDDAFPASHFPTPPPGPGAFIIKNSWGAGWGEQGYFYISYYDQVLGRSGEIFCFSHAEPVENYSRCYQYDPLGLCSSIGYISSNTAWMAAVYSAAATEQVAAVGCYALAPDTAYEIRVYRTPTSGPVNGGTLLSQQSGVLAEPGFRTIPLATPAPIMQGESFSVVVKLTTPGVTYPIALEKKVSGFSSGATHAPGQTYISATGSSWTDLSTNSSANACLKAYTRPALTPLSAVTLAATPAAPQPATTVVTLTATATGGADLRYRFETSTDQGATWTSLRDFADDHTHTWTPDAVGAYRLRVIARDAADGTQQTSSVMPYSTTASITLTPASIIVPEGDTATVQVVLAARPLQQTVVTLARASGDADLTIAPTTMNFTGVNWNVPQTATLTATRDDDAMDGTASFRAEATGWNAAELLATEDDTDTQALLLSRSAVSITEGTTDTVTVRLSARPAGTVTVSTAHISGASSITVHGGASLTFTPANWQTAQTVTIAAAKDAGAVNDTATFRVSAPGWGQMDCMVTSVDVDTQALVVSALAVSVPEGGTATFTVRLSAAPVANVTVAVARQSGDADISITQGASLLFTPTNWQTPQTVTVAAAKDADAVNGSAVVSCSAPEWTAVQVLVTEDDSNTPAIVFDHATLDIPQGGTASWGVMLAAAPVTPLTVTVTEISGQTGITLDGGASLTFSATNWHSAQTVTAHVGASATGAGVFRATAEGWVAAELAIRIEQPPTAPTINTPLQGDIVTTTPEIRLVSSAAPTRHVTYTIELTNGGITRLWTTPSTPSGVVVTHRMPREDALTPGQWTLRTRCVDVNGVSSPWTASRTLTVPNAVPALSVIGGYCQIGLPMQLDGISREAFGLHQVPVAAWDAALQRYRTHDEVTTFTTGQGYWVKSSAPLALYGAGKPVTGSYTIPLKTGWNHISPPFTRPVPWDHTRIRVKRAGTETTLAEAATLGWIENYAWGWKQAAGDPFTGNYDLVCDPTRIPGHTAQMEPWQGYWVRALLPCELVLPEPARGAVFSRALRASAGAGWQFHLRCGGGAGNAVLLGLHGEARDVTIGLPPAAPAAMPHGTRIAVARQGGEFAVVLRGQLTARESWDLVVTRGATDTGDLTLTWPDLHAVPRRYAVMLVDQETGATCYMRTATSYTIPAARAAATHRFQVVLETTFTHPPQIARLRAVSTRDAAAPVAVIFSVTEPATATVAVRTLTGKLVRQYAMTPVTPDAETMVRWDGRDTAGRAVARGGYLVEVEVRDANARQSRAVTMLQLP